jgi:alpha-L-rhamnosidase
VIPCGLRVEHLDHPLGIHTAAPRFSWRLPEGVARLEAYRIRTSNGWDTGRVDSDRSLLIAYDGPELRSAERVTWQVRAWPCDWSEPAWFEMGLLSPDDWTTRWIEPSAPLVRTTFTGRPSRLYLTAHGIYEAFVNGVRVGDAELAPGFTQYRTRLQVQTYDIADLVRPVPTCSRSC